MSQDEHLKLEKSLSPAQVWALALGSIVGWGCFVLPGDMFLPQAGPLGTLIGFLVGACLLCFVAVCYSYMIKYAPVAGGAFAYAYVGFGPTAAFICGWALVLGYIAIIGIDIAALALIFRFLFPGVFEFGALYSIAGWDVYTGEVLLMSGATLLFGWLNYRGISFAGKLQVVLAFLLTVGIVGLFSGASTLETASIGNLVPLFAEHRSVLSCVLLIFAISPFLFVGFDTVPQAAEEFSFDPARARNIMIIAILCGVVLYSLVTLSVAIVIPYPEMLAKMDAIRASGGTAWATGEAATMAFGKFGATVLACAVMGAVCTGINGFYIATSRLLLSMARGGILPSWFGDIHPTYRSPYKAILFTIGIVLLTPFAGRAVVVWIVDMSSVGTGIGYLFTCLAARRVLLGSPEVSERAVRMFCCIMGTLTAVMCIVLLLVPGSPASIGVASRWCLVVWVSLGVFFYFSNKSEWAKLPEADLRAQILGRRDIPVFFKSREPRPQLQEQSSSVE
ncbi:amino acid permease [Pseudodesulfovibrio sp. JC047]|uniref:APC family permease n=1 Tax=Pseudodesulfovibrio sp. JC047 TaxID=2683199 RepID=UPI0013D1036F|nr:APC family permease [Pseudodesulfovibrio sp. JC047]NDV18674.1 amino acid permease [Pseudodesulfovibrio sp. JC047]